MEKKEKLVLIDSNAVIHRAYHALPKSMRTSRGELTNAVYGYTTTLIKVLEDLKPQYIAATFDISKSTKRHQAYKEYKATRVEADQELYDQIPMAYELLNVLNIPVYTAEGYEADDCIGAAIDQIHSKNPNIEVYIVTGDKDLFQLLNGQVFVYWLKKGLSQADIVDSKRVNEQFNLQPEDFIDLKALAGDASDNIPGVPGIGPKTATDLLIRFDTLKIIYEQIEKVIGDTANPSLIEEAAKKLEIRPRIVELLINYKEQAFLSQNLATIDRTAPVEIDLDQCRWGNYDKEVLKEFFQRMQFNSLLRRFGATNEEIEVKTKKAKEQKEKDRQLKLL